MWITNGGFADLFIVFAKVDGEQFTAFLVERSFPGVSSGQEEHKLGLHGSSTTPLAAAGRQGSREPRARRGRARPQSRVQRPQLRPVQAGGDVAAAAPSRHIGGVGRRTRATRRQFGQPIASFGAIRHKLGEMAIREYAVESMLYRTAGLIDGMLQGNHDSAGVLAALEEFAIEASILKVAASEMLDFVLDENVQIHGGNGFVKDYPAERHYRDARVNRIFEGTNEINRLLVPGMLARRAVKGGLPLIAAARKLQDELLTPTALEPAGRRTVRKPSSATVAAMKKVALMVLGTAMQTYGDKLADQQEVLSSAADIIIDVYAAESAVLRASQASAPAARRRRRRVRERRRRTRRDRRATGARGDERRRHAAHAAGCAPPRDEGHAGQYRRTAAADRGCGHRTEGISFLAGSGFMGSQRMPKCEAD